MISMVEISHRFLEPVLHRQALCIDGTLGQGKDTAFFLSFPIRQAAAFEIQTETARRTQERLGDARLKVFSLGHEHMERELKEWSGRTDAVIFNFGWDPGRSSGIQSQPETSLEGVRQAVAMLRPKGRMALVFYPHETGVKEKIRIMNWLKEQPGLELLLVEHPNKNSPSVCLCEKKAKAVSEKLQNF